MSTTVPRYLGILEVDFIPGSELPRLEVEYLLCTLQRYVLCRYKAVSRPLKWCKGTFCILFRLSAQGA